jgi:hypothetical protein
MQTSTTTEAAGRWQPCAAGPLSGNASPPMTPGWHTGSGQNLRAVRSRRSAQPIFLPRKGWECQTRTHKRKPLW